MAGSPDPLDLAPKVELHLHLEGAIPRDTLWSLIQRYGGNREVPTREALDARLRYTSFAHFIDVWWWMTGYVRDTADFSLVAEEVAGDLARQNIVYAEASFSPSDFERHGLTPQEIAIAIRAGLDRVPETQVVLNCDLVRDTGPERAAKTLDAVLEVAQHVDIRGITIGGSERRFPPELFADVFAKAADEGLRLTAHAGEAAGPESVRAALDTLGVERIGHGIRVVDDAELLRRVVDQQVPLEVCPTSNLRTGVVRGWAEHPLGLLLDRGAFVTVNSDDPTFFDTSVAAELRTATDRFGGDARQLTANAIAASWMTEAERARVTRKVDAWWSGGR